MKQVTLYKQMKTSGAACKELMQINLGDRLLSCKRHGGVVADFRNMQSQFAAGRRTASSVTRGNFINIGTTAHVPRYSPWELHLVLCENRIL